MLYWQKYIRISIIKVSRKSSCGAIRLVSKNKNKLTQWTSLRIKAILESDGFMGLDWTPRQPRRIVTVQKTALRIKRSIFSSAFRWLANSSSSGGVVLGLIKLMVGKGGMYYLSIHYYVQRCFSFRWQLMFFFQLFFFNNQLKCSWK